MQDTKQSIAELATDYISEEKGVSTVDEAISGAMDIIAEEISDQAKFRSYIREVTTDEGMITSVAKDKNRVI